MTTPVDDIQPPPINPRYPYPKLERETREDGVRHYVDPEGHALPSVTTILSATADKAFLKEWEARVGTEKANRIREEATNIGTLMHESLECFLEKRERPRGNNLIRTISRNMANVIIAKGLPGIDEIWGVESALYYPGLFAGTSDVIGVYEGEPAIMDFKTAKKMRTPEMIWDYAQQLSAYALCHDEMFGTTIKKGVIFMVTRELDYKTFIFEKEEFEKATEEFLERCSKFFAQG